MSKQNKNIAHCRSCGAEIVFMKTSKERRIPVDKSSVPPEDLKRIEEGRLLDFNKSVHTSHFVTCPSAAKHRKSKVKQVNCEQGAFFKSTEVKL